MPLSGASERLSIASLIRHSDSLIHVDLLSPVSAEELRTAAPRKAVYRGFPKGGQASAAVHQNPEQLRIEAAGGAPLRVLRVQSRRLNSFGVCQGLSPSWGAFDRHRSPFLPAMSVLSSPSGELSTLGHKLLDLDANLDLIWPYDDGVTSHTAFACTCTDLQLAYASCRNLDPEGGGSARKFTSTPLPLVWAEEPATTVHETRYSSPLAPNDVVALRCWRLQIERRFEDLCGKPRQSTDFPHEPRGYLWEESLHVLRGWHAAAELRRLNDGKLMPLHFTRDPSDIRDEREAMLSTSTWRHLVVIDAIGVHVLDFLPRACWKRAQKDAAALTSS